jgi:two-component system chemotaxis sensor kinase CheA
MMDDFFRKHKDAFLNEAASHIENMNASLLQLEKTPDNQNLIHEIFRSAHTLKSMAATMAFERLVKLCHSIEDLLEGIKTKKIELSACSNILFECFDLLNESLIQITAHETEVDTEALCQRVQALVMNDTKNITTPEPESNMGFAVVEKIKTIGVKVERLDTLMNLVEELLVSRIKLDLLRESINNFELTAVADSLGRHIKDLQYAVMQVRLVPIGFLFNRFPRMVRDVAKAQNKEVDLKVEGGEIELDRSLVDEISEALVHLIRNAIDHGIETTTMREQNNKPPRATISLTAKRTKEFALIEVSDDGAGLDIGKIRNAAIEKNLAFVNTQDEGVIDTIFKGISTTKKVTALSGRGLGLSIVRQRIQSIGGSIQVKSKHGQGTTFYIRIPLTLAVIKVLFVTVSNQIYAIPINKIDRLLSVPAEDIKGLLNFNAIVYQDEEIPVTHLAKLFSHKAKKMENYPIVVIKQDENRYGIVVDGLLSTQEVVIKPLTKIVKENKHFSGTALIGSGEMVLILDIDQLFLSRRQKNEWRRTGAI